MTNKLAAVKAVSSFIVKSKLGREYIISLIELAVLNQLLMCWIPGSSIEGNQSVDELLNINIASTLFGENYSLCRETF